MGQTRLDIARIRSARQLINPVFLDTPLYRCAPLDTALGCKVSIKLETANPVGSFKARAAEVVTSHLVNHGSTAVVCASAGNLGQALAWSGKARGLEVRVVASRDAPAVKLDRIRALGASLDLVDGDIEIAREHAALIAQRTGGRLVEDSLDIETCEAAATIGLELAAAASSPAAATSTHRHTDNGSATTHRAMRPAGSAPCQSPLDRVQLWIGRLRS